MYDMYERVNKQAAHAWLAASAREIIKTIKAGRLQPFETDAA